jgi:histidine ammonia-lyase
MRNLTIDCSSLSISDIRDVARAGRQVRLGSRAIEAMQASRAVVDRATARHDIVYGVTTGFGKLADQAIPAHHLEQLQHNLILSHSVGVGEPLPTDAVRGMMLLRLASLARGYSGVRVEVVERLCDLLNHQITPVVPSRGSVGASGDLAPLAHLALVLIGRGEAEVKGRRVAGSEALRLSGLTPLRLAAKEGLALINGTQMMCAIGALLVADALNLLDVADIAGAMSLEAIRGTDRAFDARVHLLRPHPGQIASARQLCRLTKGSEIMHSHRHDTHRVQDPYSFRCMPQVHGASRDAIHYLRAAIETEANSVTDNPLIFGDEGEIISCGNFHGQPVAIALDLASIALAELANISERRIEAMLNPHMSELPPFLTMRGGVESGFMVSQYTAASLVSENKVLAHPASVDSIPTSANQEDHVSMGATAALKVQQILRNTETVLAIELLCAAEGIEHRRPLRTSSPLERVYDRIRLEIPHLHSDRVLHPDIERMTTMVHEGIIAEAACEASGA